MSSEMSAIMTGAPEDPLPHGLLVPRRHVSHLSRLTPHIPLTGDSMPSSQHAYLIEQSASSNECKRAAPNCDATSESRANWHMVCPMPHRRCTCSAFNCNA